MSEKKPSGSRARKPPVFNIEDFCLMDDEYMTVYFDGQTACMEHTLRIILDKPGLRVVSVRGQHTIANMYGRGGRLDIRAADSGGRLYNVEVQRADKGAGAKRARFNVGLMDTRELGKGRDTEELAEVYVIFITENDVLGEGLPVYHIDRMVRETGKPFEDKAHIVYVNGAYRGAGPIGDLMHDFSCRRPEDMRSRVLAERARYLKGNAEEVRKVSYIVEELVRKSREAGLEEGREDERLETAARLLAEGIMPEGRIAAFFRLSPEQMEEVREMSAGRQKSAPFP